MGNIRDNKKDQATNNIDNFSSSSVGKNYRDK